MQESTTLPPDRMAPHSAEAEEAVLGSVLLNSDSLFEVASFLQPDDFFIVRNSWVWEAILRLQERNEQIDYVTVVEELRQQSRLDDIGGAAYITYLINHTPSSIYAEAYGRIVERAAIRRRLLASASEIAQLAHEESADINEVIDRSEASLFAVTERRLRKELVPINIAISDYYDRIEHLYEHRGEPLGVPSGFIDLDRLLGGLQKSDLIIVAGRPGMGKTSWLLSVALNAARARARVAIFSMEMSNEQIVQRLVSSETGISTQNLRLGKLDDREWTLFVEATGNLSNVRIFLDDTPAQSPIQMRTKCRRLYAEHGLDLIMVDYLQLMNSGSGRVENRVQEISFISRQLKQLARELNVPVLAAAQLSRAVEQRQDKRPQLSDLRESGCLTGDTPVVMADTGETMPLRDLSGKAGFAVWALNESTLKLERAEVSRAFPTGTKPVYRLTTRLGRTIRATANHQFRTIDGWRRLDQLCPHDRIALPRVLPGTASQTMQDAELALLGHLIGDGRNQYHVIVSGKEDTQRFIEQVSAVGTRRQRDLAEISEYIQARASNTNRDIVPDSVWRTHAIPAMTSLGMTGREMQAELGNAYCGTGLYRQNLSRERAARLATVVQSADIARLADSDVYWDGIVSIEPDGEEEVFDLTVPDHHNFIAANIIVHNSIEQDADVVMFIYREDAYNENTEKVNQADILVSKHRNGPTGVVTLFFRKELTQFSNLNRTGVDLTGF